MQPFEPRNEDYRDEVIRILGDAPFMNALGVEFVDCGPGWCDSQLVLRENHCQHDGVVHAGVAGAMADHTAGAASGSLIEKGQLLLTVEYKINILRPGHGESLRCHAEVIRPGRTITVAESNVYAVQGEVESHIAKAIVTIAVVSAEANN